jgi:hypothetical protein
MTKRSMSLVAVSAALWLMLCSNALAADFYVDQETGSDSDDCSTPALACLTIQNGVTLATNEGANNTLRVDDSPTPYVTDSVTLFSDISVIADNSVVGSTTESPTGRPIIQTASAAGQALFVQGVGSPGTTIAGFTFMPNDHAAISVSGAMTAIQNNDFEGPLSPSALDDDKGIALGASSPTIANNVFANLKFGITESAAGTPTITGNDFSGTHNGNALEVQIGSPTIADNFFHAPGASAAQAVRLGSPGSTSATAATFRRNTIVYATDLGVNIADTAGPISFSNDVIADATLDGIVVADTDDNGDTAVSATNVTIESAGGAAGEMEVNNAQVVLDSSIIGAAGITDVGTGTCAITFSGGPVSTAGGSGCDNFQTTADPAFVNASAVDFHLQPTSPFIDAGNPTTPPGGTLDLDGDARALDGNCDGTARRDIGADELVKNCPPPPSGGNPLPSTPPTTTAKRKKCKKAKKQASAAKKRCKKRK